MPPEPDIATWSACQQHSDAILSSGLGQLVDSVPVSIDGLPGGVHGNYLISYRDTPLYIGEAKDLKRRLKQQFSSRSTFFKTYTTKAASLGLPNNLSLDDFNVKTLATRIGRKEMEEFGIVHLDTPLNKFQRGKRAKIDLSPSPHL